MQKELRAITTIDDKSVVVLQTASRIMLRCGFAPPRRTEELLRTTKDMESNGMCAVREGLL